MNSSQSQPSGACPRCQRGPVVIIRALPTLTGWTRWVYQCRACQHTFSVAGRVIDRRPL